MKPPAPAEIEAALTRMTRNPVTSGARGVVVHASAAEGDYGAASDIDAIVV